LAGKVYICRADYSLKDENAKIDIYKTQTPDKKYIEIGEITCRDTNDEWALEQTLML